ncbi:MAG: hypothetical protein MHM6MM_005026 [Cercozoa sp. M6MM]
MSVNSTIFVNGQPVLCPHERQFFECDKVRFDVEAGDGFPGNGGLFYGYGRVIVTNLRVILQVKMPTAAFSSATLPWLLVTRVEHSTSGFLSSPRIRIHAQNAPTGGFPLPVKVTLHMHKSDTGASSSDLKARLAFLADEITSHYHAAQSLLQNPHSPQIQHLQFAASLVPLLPQQAFPQQFLQTSMAMQTQPANRGAAAIMVPGVSDLPIQPSDASQPPVQHLHGTGMNNLVDDNDISSNGLGYSAFAAPASAQHAALVEPESSSVLVPNLTAPVQSQPPVVSTTGDMYTQQLPRSGTIEVPVQETHFEMADMSNSTSHERVPNDDERGRASDETATLLRDDRRSAIN